jgi:hypothetical protein
MSVCVSMITGILSEFSPSNSPLFIAKSYNELERSLLTQN